MSRRKYRSTPWLDPFPASETVVSANECTGLLTSRIDDPMEGVALSHLENIHPIEPMKEEKDKD